MTSELKNCYEAVFYKAYDEFAAMLGSEEDIEQVPGKYNSSKVFLKYDDAIKFIDTKMKKYGNIDSYAAYIIKYGPRGGRKQEGSWYSYSMWKDFYKI